MPGRIRTVLGGKGRKGRKGNVYFYPGKEEPKSKKGKERFKEGTYGHVFGLIAQNWMRKHVGTYGWTDDLHHIVMRYSDTKIPNRKAFPIINVNIPASNASKKDINKKIMENWARETKTSDKWCSNLTNMVSEYVLHDNPVKNFILGDQNIEEIYETLSAKTGKNEENISIEEVDAYFSYIIDIDHTNETFKDLMLRYRILEENKNTKKTFCNFIRKDDLSTYSVIHEYYDMRGRVFKELSFNKKSELEGGYILNKIIKIHYSISNDFTDIILYKIYKISEINKKIEIKGLKIINSKLRLRFMKREAYEESEYKAELGYYELCKNRLSGENISSIYDPSIYTDKVEYKGQTLLLKKGQISLDYEHIPQRVKDKSGCYIYFPDKDKKLYKEDIEERIEALKKNPSLALDESDAEGNGPFYETSHFIINKNGEKEKIEEERLSEELRLLEEDPSQFVERYKKV